MWYEEEEEEEEECLGVVVPLGSRKARIQASPGKSRRNIFSNTIILFFWGKTTRAVGGAGRRLDDVDRVPRVEEEEEEEFIRIQRIL